MRARGHHGSVGARGGCAQWLASDPAPLVWASTHGGGRNHAVPRDPERGTRIALACLQRQTLPASAVVQCAALVWAALVWAALVWAALVWAALVWAALVWAALTCAAHPGAAQASPGDLLCFAPPNSNTIVVHTPAGGVVTIVTGGPGAWWQGQVPLRDGGLATLALGSSGFELVRFDGAGQVVLTFPVPELTTAHDMALTPSDELLVLTLSAADLPPGVAVLFLASRAGGLVPSPGGSAGVLCLGGAIGRFLGPGQVQQASAAGDAALVVFVTSLPTPTGPVSITHGETWHFQAWHRDIVGGAATSNFSTAQRATFQ